LIKQLGYCLIIRTKGSDKYLDCKFINDIYVLQISPAFSIEIACLWKNSISYFSCHFIIYNEAYPRLEKP